MNPIYVTEPFLPTFDEYMGYIRGIWNRKLLTNQGPLVKELEHKLKEYHRITMPVHSVVNGGAGLQLILKALGVSGEVITTPFSYVATASCPLWEGCQVRFADIEPEFLTLSTEAVEAAITSKTEAILATHVFGTPCDLEGLECLAQKYSLALIYDAAHAFGITYKGRSILEWGDTSMVSLHATKVFHAVEGGFVVARDREVAEKIEWMRRFGHDGHDGFYGVGINAKMSEFHAAMGLCNLDHIQKIIANRKVISEAFDSALAELGGRTKVVATRSGASRNYGYYPVLFENENSLRHCISTLNESNIFPRRYFFPCLSGVPELGKFAECSVAANVASRILCLPLSASMRLEDVDRVIKALCQATL